MFVSRLRPFAAGVVLALLAACGSNPSGPAGTTGAAPPHSPVTTAPPAPAPLTSAQLAALPTSWRPLAVGAGGFITGIDLNPDGETRVIRTDTYGGYIWRGNRWQQLLLDSTLPAGDRTLGSTGVVDLVSAPSNPQRLYMYVRNRVYRSDDQGLSWQRTAFPEAEADANGEFRTGSHLIAVDPANSAVLHVGTPRNGLWQSLDAGASWVRVATVPAGRDEVNSDGVARPGAGISLFYDSSSGIENGRTRIVYAGSWRNGIWRSTNGGATWSQISAPGTGPVSAWRASVAGDGTVYLAEGPLARTWRYRGGTWANISPAQFIYAIAADPGNPDRVYAFTDGGTPWRSVDGGTSWTRLDTPSIRQSSGDIPWHSFTDEDYMSTAEVRFDPRVPGRLWFAMGIGVWRADVTDSTSRISWQAESRGIEQLVVNDIIAPPGQRPVLAAWDRAIFVLDNVDAFPATHGPTRRFNSAWQLDWSGGSPGFLVANTSDHRFCCTEDGLNIQAGWSADGGRTWTRFARIPSPPGSDPTNPRRFGFGAIAVAANDIDNIVWLPTDNGAAAYTRNRGVSWSFVTLPGQSSTAPGSHFAFFLNRKVLAADRVQPNTFYLAHSGGPNGEARGVWRTTDGGASWTRMFDREITPFSVFNAMLKAVPDRAGHLYFTPGQLDGREEPLMRSTDGGATWRPVGTAAGVYAFGFGKPLEPGGYPTLYIAGSVGGSYGIWRSTDEGQGWTRLTTFPGGTLDQVSAVEGDKDRFGRVYVGLRGSGAVYGDIGQP